MSQRFYSILITFIAATIVAVAANNSDTFTTSASAQDEDNSVSPAPVKAEGSAATATQTQGNTASQPEGAAGTQRITGTLSDKETKEAAVKVLKGEKTGADGVLGSILGSAVDLFSGKK